MVKRIIIGISGASGVIYGIRILEILKEIRTIESHLILSPTSEKIISLETNYSVNKVIELADCIHDYADLSAAPSSGSFLTDGMIIAPCSMKTLSGIVNSYNDNLLVRSADVTLKERRKLVVVPRETPFHLGHLDMMSRLTQYGGVVLPPVPAFYSLPKDIGDIIDQTIGKILDQFGIEHHLFQRWETPGKIEKNAYRVPEK